VSDRCDNCKIELKADETDRSLCRICRENYPALARQEEAWLLLYRWENIARNGGERWLREHPLVAETTALLHAESAASYSGIREGES
jgi:hypothetical protein